MVQETSLITHQLMVPLNLISQSATTFSTPLTIIHIAKGKRDHVDILLLLLLFRSSSSNMGKEGEYTLNDVMMEVHTDANQVKSLKNFSNLRWNLPLKEIFYHDGPTVARAYSTTDSAANRFAETVYHRWRWRIMIMVDGLFLIFASYGFRYSVYWWPFSHCVRCKGWCARNCWLRSDHSLISALQTLARPNRCIRR